jgi:hypothetical protein
MRARRVSLIVAALVVANALAINLCWLYRFGTTEACPTHPRSCLGWFTPWERLVDTIKTCRLERTLPNLDSRVLFRYEWREFASLASVAAVLMVAMFVILRGLEVVPWRLRLRTMLLLVALAAVEFQAIRELWSAVDAWEFRQMRKGSICCIDTWIWGDDL